MEIKCVPVGVVSIIWRHFLSANTFPLWLSIARTILFRDIIKLDFCSFFPDSPAEFWPLDPHSSTSHLYFSYVHQVSLLCFRVRVISLWRCTPLSSESPTLAARFNRNIKRIPRSTWLILEVLQNSCYRTRLVGTNNGNKCRCDNNSRVHWLGAVRDVDLTITLS